MPHEAVAVITERQKRRRNWQRKSRQELARTRKRHEQATRRVLLRDIHEEAVALVGLLGAATPPYKDGTVVTSLVPPFGRYAVWHVASILDDAGKYRELYFRDDGTVFMTRHVDRIFRWPLAIAGEQNGTLANIHKALRAYRTRCLREIEATA